jgi:hypothetical protein
MQICLSDKSQNFTTEEWFEREKAESKKLTIDEMRDVSKF